MTFRTVLAGVLALALLGTAAAAPQAKPPRKKGEELPQAKVDAAIQNGIQYLWKNIDELKPVTIHGPTETGDELLLLALLRGGLRETDPVFQKLFNGMMERKLLKTYSVSLQAMVLEELDRVKYQYRILQCAQFLVDNQCKYGEFGYGDASPFVETLTPTTSPKGAATPSGSALKKDAKLPPGERKKPAVVRRIPVEQKRIRGDDTGDFSCTQYAILGLRACHDAGIILPEQVLSLAMSRLRRGRIPDPSAPGLSGFCYFLCQAPHAPYGSMTAGSVGSLVILDHIKDGPLSWQRDVDVQEGLKWMGAKFTAKEVPGPHHFTHGLDKNHPCNTPQWFFYYYLYAVERLGMLTGIDVFGPHDWYPEGARVLVETQAADGSWGGPIAARGERGGDTLFNTAWAILFLRRATRPLIDVASEDRMLPKK